MLKVKPQHLQRRRQAYPLLVLLPDMSLLIIDHLLVIRFVNNHQLLMRRLLPSQLNVSLCKVVHAEDKLRVSLATSLFSQHPRIIQHDLCYFLRGFHNRSLLYSLWVATLNEATLQQGQLQLRLFKPGLFLHPLFPLHIQLL